MIRSTFSLNFLLSLLFSIYLVASEESPVSTKCTREELISFFPRAIVEKVLIDFQIQPQVAQQIATKLVNKDREITKIIEEKSSQIHSRSNDNLQRESALKIYVDTIHDAFSSVAHAYGITDEKTIQQILEQIRVLRSKNFIECIRQNKIPREPSED